MKSSIQVSNLINLFSLSAEKVPAMMAMVVVVDVIRGDVFIDVDVYAWKKEDIDIYDDRFSSLFSSTSLE